MTSLAVIVGRGSAGIGAAGLWLDRRFDDAPPAEAVVALSEDARLDVEVPTEADDGTFTRAIVWSEGAEFGIGDGVSVQLVDSPKGWARIVGDERLSSCGRWLLFGGAAPVLSTMVGAVLAGRRRKRVRQAAVAHSVSEAATTRLWLLLRFSLRRASRPEPGRW